MRRLTVGLTVLVVVASVLGVSVASGATFFEGFDYPPGTTPPDPPWGESRPHPDTDVVVEVVEGDNVLHVQDNLSFVGGSAGLGHKLDSPISGTYYLDYDVRIGNLGLHNASIWLYGDGGNDSTVQYSNGANGGTAGWFHIYGPPGSGYNWFQDPLLEAKAGTWYHVTRTLNMVTNDGTFEMWERDNPAISSGIKTFGAWVSSSFIDTLRIETDGMLRADTYYDNIRFSTSPIPEPSTLALLSLGALTLTIGWWRRRRAA